MPFTKVIREMPPLQQTGIKPQANGLKLGVLGMAARLILAVTQLLKQHAMEILGTGKNIVPQYKKQLHAVCESTGYCLSYPINTPQLKLGVL